MVIYNDCVRGNIVLVSVKLAAKDTRMRCIELEEAKKNRKRTKQKGTSRSSGAQPYALVAWHPVVYINTRNPIKILRYAMRIRAIQMCIIKQKTPHAPSKKASEKKEINKKKKKELGYKSVCRPSSIQLLPKADRAQ